MEVGDVDGAEVGGDGARAGAGAGVELWMLRGSLPRLPLEATLSLLNVAGICAKRCILLGARFCVCHKAPALAVKEAA